MKIETRSTEFTYDTSTEREILVVGEASGNSVWIDEVGCIYIPPLSLTKAILKARHASEIRAGELVIEKNDLADKLRVAEGKITALIQAARQPAPQQLLEAKASVPTIDPTKFIELLTASVERISAAVRGPLTPRTPGP